jgi:hypothetical protein
VNHPSVYRFGFESGNFVPLIAKRIHQSRLQSSQNRNRVKELRREQLCHNEDYNRGWDISVVAGISCSNAETGNEQL